MSEPAAQGVPASIRRPREQYEGGRARGCGLSPRGEGAATWRAHTSSVSCHISFSCTCCGEPLSRARNSGGSAPSRVCCGTNVRRNRVPSSAEPEHESSSCQKQTRRRLAPLTSATRRFGERTRRRCVPTPRTRSPPFLRCAQQQHAGHKNSTLGATAVRCAQQQHAEHNNSTPR